MNSKRLPTLQFDITTHRWLKMTKLIILQHGRGPRPRQDKHARLATVEGWRDPTGVHTAEAGSQGPQRSMGTVGTWTVWSDKSDFVLEFCFWFIIFHWSLSLEMRPGDTRVALLVLWLYLRCCWKDSSGALPPSLWLWLWSTPSSHQRREATDTHHFISSQDIDGVSHFSVYLLIKMFVEPSETYFIHRWFVCLFVSFLFDQ